MTKIKEHSQQMINRLREGKQSDAIMIDDPYLIKKKAMDILLKWKMECGTLPVAVIKNKRLGVAKQIKLQNATDNDDYDPHPDWTEELEAELQQIRNEDLTIKDTEVGREKNKVFNNTFKMILVASPTTKQAILASLSVVGNNNFNLVT